MAKPRGRSHTTLTETATMVVKVLRRLPNITMIAPGEIIATRKRRSGKRHCTCVVTNPGLQLIITGQSVQNLSVHTSDPRGVIDALKNAKSLGDFAFSVREKRL
jgi:hypothetical protein